MFKKNVISFGLSLFSFFVVGQKLTTHHIEKYKICELQDSILETSGLDFFNGKLFTFNDGGNAADLFEIDKNNGKILNTFHTKLNNKDWEAIANDGLNLYVGDFGNNTGVRKDLRIYKIPFSAFNGLDIEEPLVQTLAFNYPEQQDFTPRNANQDFDAEAMIFLNGNLHVFTKEWKSKNVSHYLINPNTIDKQAAQKLEQYHIQYVVTDAAYFKNKLYLIGYTKKAKVFLDIFEETKPGLFFENPPKRYKLGSSVNLGQLEGIAVNNDGVYISGEKFKSPFGLVKQSFYFIPMDKF